MHIVNIGHDCSGQKTSFFLILSRLDYCNSLLSGMPQHLIDKLQKVENCSDRLIFKTSKSIQASPLLTNLHWFLIAPKKVSKFFSPCTMTQSQKMPRLTCLGLLLMCIPSSSLRSSADTQHLSDSTTKEKVPRHRTFSRLGLVTWNKLPYSVRHAATKSQFKTQLKTTPFLSAHGPNF